MFAIEKSSEAISNLAHGTVKSGNDSQSILSNPGSPNYEIAKSN